MCGAGRWPASCRSRPPNREDWQMTKEQEMQHPFRSIRFTRTVIAAALALHAPGAARAANLYKIQPIFTIGEQIGSVQTNADGDIEMNSLNDAGQFSIVTEAAPKGETLLQYAGG